MAITLIASGMIGLLLVYLSYNVSANRLKTKTDLGDGGHPEMLLAMRAQGNLIEYAPTGLIIIGLLEFCNANQIFVAVLATLFVLGRYMHGLTLGKVSGKNPFRIVGTLFTWLVIVVGAIAAIVMGGMSL